MVSQLLGEELNFLETLFAFGFVFRLALVEFTEHVLGFVVVLEDLKDIADGYARRPAGQALRFGPLQGQTAQCPRCRHRHQPIRLLALHVAPR
jgi:hypothetical protein